MSNPSPSYDDTLYVRDHCLCLAAQRTARALARRFDELFRPFDITNGQFSLLMALNRPEPPALGAVAELLAMDRTTLTAALKPLEKRGLAESRPDEKDRRARRIALTAKGRAVLADALPLWRQEHARIEALLEALDSEALTRGMAALTKTARPVAP